MRLALAFRQGKTLEDPSVLPLPSLTTESYHVTSEVVTLIVNVLKNELPGLFVDCSKLSDDATITVATDGVTDVRDVANLVALVVNDKLRAIGAPLLG